MLYRKDIQGLRAIAVLSVLIFHINEFWLQGGFIGVDVFFVISGYLITSIIYSKKESNTFNFKSFYLSRIKRIVPAYYIMILFVMFVSCYLFVEEAKSLQTFKEIIGALAFVSNMIFANQDSYFDSANHFNPLLHTWTLSIEMQFYLFLPFLIIFCPKKWLKPLISILIILLFLYASYDIIWGLNKQAVYFSLLARTPEFLMGSIICFFRSRYVLKTTASTAFSALGLILVLSSMFFINEKSDFPGLFAAIPCLGACLILMANSNFISDKLLSNRLMVLLGEWSYSIYLWHWPILAFWRYYSLSYEITSLKYLIFLLVLIFSCSILSYYIIESFFRKKVGYKFWSLFGAILAVIIVGLFVYKPIAKTRIFVPSEYSEQIDGVLSHGETFQFVETLGDTMAVNQCNILLMGDSKTLYLKPYLDSLGKENHFKLRTISTNAYPLIDGLDNIYNSPKPYKTYLKLLEIAKKEMKDADIIIFTCYKNGVDFKNDFKNLSNQLRDDQFLLFVKDNLAISKPLMQVVRSINKKDYNVDYSVIKRNIPEEIVTIMKERNHIDSLELTSPKIEKEFPFYNDTILTYDLGHLNSFASRMYYKETKNQFKAKLDSIIDVLTK